MTDKHQHDWEQAVARMVELTRSGELKWDRAFSVTRPDAISDIYEATIQGRKLVVYEYRYRSLEQMETGEEVAIEFVDAMGKSEWRWPEVASRWALLDAVRYQIAGAASFLKQLLGSA